MPMGDSHPRGLHLNPIYEGTRTVQVGDTVYYVTLLSTGFQLNSKEIIDSDTLQV